MNKIIEQAKKEHCKLTQGFPDNEYLMELDKLIYVFNKYGFKSIEELDNYLMFMKMENGEKQMSKELEALERYGYHCNHYVNGEKDYKIIERALKEHELMKQTKSIVADAKISKEDLKKIKNQRMFVSDLQPCEIKPLFDEETKKKLKALEIIKSKGVAVGMLQLEEVGLKEYNDFIGDKKLYLTKEQFDLLKEVLL